MKSGLGELDFKEKDSRVLGFMIFSKDWSWYLKKPGIKIKIDSKECL